MDWCLRKVVGKWMFSNDEKVLEKESEKSKNLLGDYNNICYTKIDAVLVAQKSYFFEN